MQGYMRMIFSCCTPYLPTVRILVFHLLGLVFFLQTLEAQPTELLSRNLV